MNRITENPMVVRALQVAEQKLGIEQLSRRLSAPDATLRAWRDGQATMPQHRFLLLVDLLTALDPAWYDGDKTSP